MRLFWQKQNAYLGVDFGAAGIKLVQLSRASGRGRALFSYGFFERPVEEIGTDYLDNAEATAAMLKRVCERARITATDAIAALPIPAVFSSVISIARVPQKELPQAVRWEAKKLIPLPLEEVVLDFKELPSVPVNSGQGGDRAGEEKDVPAQTRKVSDQKTISILLTAAPKSVIDKYIAIAAAAGLRLVSLETEAFALIRSLLGVNPIPTVIVDIGAIRSNILIIDRGIPMLTRSVQIGGKDCTAAVAKQSGMDVDKAESMKRDISAGYGDKTGAALAPVFQEVFKPLVNEIQYSFHVYRTRSMVARPPERIILTGGGSGVRGLADFFEKQFKLRSFPGNPWESIAYHKDLTPILQSLGTRFSVAIGLALRNIREK